jgi:hypothetical protein
VSAARQSQVNVSYLIGNFGESTLFNWLCVGQPSNNEHQQGVQIVQKPFTYALLLAAMLGLAACEKTPEDKLESAKESATEAIESMGDAIDETGEAIEDKAEAAMGDEPTAGEKIEEAADDAAEAIEEAGDKAKDAVDAQ